MKKLRKPIGNRSPLRKKLWFLIKNGLRTVFPLSLAFKVLGGEYDEIGTITSLLFGEFQ
jgi:hypothetical protein